MIRPPSTAMVLAAGLGTRMAPLTRVRPKALVEVAGRALIDHVLDRLSDAGVERAVVNVHAFADRLESHLLGRDRPKVVISDERRQLLETGGGLKHARLLLGDAPVFVANIDSVWLETGPPALATLADAFDSERMDACLLLTPTDRALGFDGPGDFDKASNGELRFRGHDATAPFAYVGVHITRPQVVDVEESTPFSLTRVWRRLAEDRRLFGVVLDGTWMHVGDPAARQVAESQLAAMSAQ